MTQPKQPTAGSEPALEYSPISPREILTYLENCTNQKPEISRRDYFAAMAMQGVIGYSAGINITTPEIATVSVSLADALLAELSKGGEK